MVKAVIFDMDGVLSDTQEIHAQVDSKVLKKFGVFITPEEMSTRFSGVRCEDILQQLLENPRKEKEAYKERWKLVLESGDQIKPIQPTIDILNKLKDYGIKAAVASSSIPEYIELVLSKLGIADKFDAVVSGQDIENGKPSPDIFLLAARKIEVHPSNCLVVEDTRSGMTGAKRAGMKCVGIVPNVRAAYPADILVSNLTDLTIQEIRNM